MIVQPPLDTADIVSIRVCHPQPIRRRSGILTRKATDASAASGANSLSAQRQWAEDFIAERTHQGWVLLPERYDDGGESGAKMDRPALQRLLADIRDGKIDRVVVHSFDRLSRSLPDLERIIETLKSHDASLVCVTDER